MPEPMSAVEIEDVLSSIRRLVSEDLRPSSAAPAPAPTRPDSRLILTPALRVVPRNPLEAWAESEGEGEEEDWTEELPSPPLGASGWSLPEAEPEPAELELAVSIPIPARAEPEPRPAPQPAAGTAAPEPALPPHRFTLTQADRVSSFASAEAEAWPALVEPVPDLGTDAAPDSFEPVARRHLAEPEDASGPEFEGAAAGPMVSSAETWPEAEHSGPEPRLAAGEAASMSDLVAEDDHWAELAAAEAIAGLHEARSSRDPLEPVSEDDPAFLEDPEQDLAGEPVYDEALLRELVRDIIREELAGNLGEKITRNIRKLVRAEIAQALATRDL